MRSIPMEFQGNVLGKWRENYFVEEILYLYTIGHYNRAVIHSAQGHFRAAYEAAQSALEVDPQFYLARELSDRMVGRVNSTPSPASGRGKVTTE
ncbi:MAG: tetratricopeptide repeat protein [Elusimicrobia bacterium]|nr:tetratricopeptide repeat protein [Elusimicrobiota bacterium]